jgi:predicted MPP superfamily phosphohydrolase
MEHSVADMRVLFTWVHLSDIHVGHGDVSYGWDQQLVMAKLKEDIATAPTEYESAIPAPDVIFVTGDLAFSGATRNEGEYAVVRDWLSDIARHLSIDNSKIFIVPGNHDVQRNAADGDKNLARLLTALRSGREAIDNVLADRGDWSLLAKRMKNYFEFAKEFGASSDPDLFWKRELTKQGLKIRITGLNTALLSADDQDKEKLEVGMSQIKKALDPLPDKSNEVVLVLSHLHLCGHIHEASSEALRSGGGASFLQVVSGAAHGERHPYNIPTSHGYNFGSLMADKEGQIVLRLWPRIWSQANTDFRVDVANAPRGRQFAEYNLDMRLTANQTGHGRGDARAQRDTQVDVSTAAQTPAPESPEGTVSPESYFFIERDVEKRVLRKIREQGVTITIKAPQQMGKSSLLMRLISVAEDTGKSVVLLDFQLFRKADLNSPEIFFRQFCNWITYELSLANRVDEFWRVELGYVHRCTRYMEHHVLQELSGPLLLAMDKVDSVFDIEFRSDFFGMLRAWHNKRAMSAKWKQLDLALVTSTEPYMFIDKPNLSPFNVGEEITLTDFTPAEVAELNRLHDSPLTAEQVQKLMSLVGGHPYLIRRALYWVATNNLDAESAFGLATDERGPFWEHLRGHLFRLQDKGDLVAAMCDVLENGHCRDEQTFFRLQGAGLVQREGQTVSPRYKLYADYFRLHLYG